MSIELSFSTLALLALVAAFHGARRYETLLNPLTVFVGAQIGLLTLLSGLVAYSRLQSAPYTEADVVVTTLVSIVYLLGTVMAYFVRVVGLVSLFGRSMRSLSLASETMVTRFDPIKFGLLLAGAVGAFTALAILGHGGSLWLTDSRTAYLSHRAGVGPFFALTQWCLAFAFLYYLWARHASLPGILAGLTFFGLVSYFTGSKNNVLTFVIIAITYYNFRVRCIPLSAFAVLVPLLLLAVLQLLVTQGSFAGFSQALAYFSDYFDTTARFLARFDEFGFLYGGGWLSDFWFYVPRGLYPDKPFEYGITLIHRNLFPGAAALGATPGILPWALAYLDFGVIGVFFAGFANGLWQRVTYEYFLKRRRSFIAFLLMMQFALWAPLPFATPGMVLGLCVALSIYLRLSVSQEPTSFDAGYQVRIGR